MLVLSLIWSLKYDIMNIEAPEVIGAFFVKICINTIKRKKVRLSVFLKMKYLKDHILLCQKKNQNIILL